MCGFAGFVGEVDDREQVLVNMMNTIVHRGPDSAGKYVDEDAALGFRRLSIIDLSSVGDQPLYNEDRSMVLVFNGEIYNYQDLREEYRFRDTDSWIRRVGRETGRPSSRNVCFCNLGYKEEKIVCSERYFWNQTAILCEYEWYIDVCF